MSETFQRHEGAAHECSLDLFGEYLSQGLHGKVVRAILWSQANVPLRARHTPSAGMDDASPSALRLVTQPVSPYDACTYDRPPNSSMPNRYQARLAGPPTPHREQHVPAPVGSPTVIRLRTSGLTTRSSRPTTRFRRSFRGDARWSPVDRV